MISIRFSLLWCAVSFVVYTLTMSSTFGWGDTRAPYKIVGGQDKKFAELTKGDLGLRCTIYIREASLPIPAHRIRDYPGGITTEKSCTVVNGELFEVGKHFLRLGWFTGDYSGMFFNISEGDIDHIALSEP